jgi:predicted ATPase
MIKNLTLTNFKKFGRASFSMSNLTLLTGLNGAGKSTVIQALAVLRQSCESGALEAGLVDLNGTYARIGTGRDALSENTFGSPSIDIGISATEGSFAVELAYNSEADHLHADIEGDIRDTPLGAKEFQHIRADRLGPETQYEHSYDLAVRQRRLGSRGEYSADTLLAFGDSTVPQARCHPSGKSDSLLDQVNAWIGQTCPGVDISAHVVSNTDLVRLEIGFGGAAGLHSSNRYRPTNVGFGVSYVLPIVVACLTAEEGSMLLIENPEAHLHPRGQSQMARLCAGTAMDGVQVVAESHSDHFLNGVRLAVKDAGSGSWARVIYFGTSNDLGYSEIGIDDRGLLSEWPDGFFDESQHLLAELLAP